MTLASMADEFHTQLTENPLAGAFHIVIAIKLIATIVERDLNNLTQTLNVKICANKAIKICYEHSIFGKDVIIRPSVNRK